jgi:hypothetical protein
MSGGINAYYAEVTGSALALGDETATDTAAVTAVWPGTAIGYAAAVAVAQDTAPDTPYTIATTDGIATGGYMTRSSAFHWSVDIPFGPTPTSVEVSVTFVSTYGGGSALSEYYGLVSPSLDGLF